jgi:hypothetical protein
METKGNNKLYDNSFEKTGFERSTFNGFNWLAAMSRAARVGA